MTRKSLPAQALLRTVALLLAECCRVPLLAAAPATAQVNPFDPGRVAQRISRGPCH